MDVAIASSLPRRGSAPAKYRLNRRAALAFTGLFLAFGALAAVVCFAWMQPERRLHQLRESADAYLRQGQWRQAALQLANVVRLAPDDEASWLKLGNVHLQILRESGDAGATAPSVAGASNLQTAVSCYRQVANLNPRNVAAQRWLLELDVRGGVWDDARQRLPIVAAEAPHDPLVVLARELIPSERRLEVARAIALLSGDSPDATKVFELLEPLHQRDPLDLDVLGPYALACAHTLQEEKREAALAAARAFYGDSRRLDLIEAECAAAAGDRTTAIRFAELAASQPGPSELPARHLLASLWRRQSLADRSHSRECLRSAIAECRRILQRQPNDQWAANNAACWLGMIPGEEAAALEITSATLAKVDEPTAPLLDTHAWLLCRQRRPHDAIPFLRHAWTLAPTDVGIPIRLAVAHWTAGQSPAALATLRDWVTGRGPAATVTAMDSRWTRLSRPHP